MKRIIKVLSLVLVFIMCFGIINVFAKGKALSNDKFYAEIPKNFEINNSGGEDHYYIEDNSGVDYLGSFEIFVEGNILFPDGIKATDIGIIKQRFKNFIYIEKIETELDIKRAEKGNINGISACYIYGVADDGYSKEFLHAYILTTKETLYMVVTSSASASFEKEPEFFKEFMSSFLVNGTYYNGEKLTKAHDFSKAEHYIDALERDVLTDAYYSYHSGTIVFGLIFIISVLVFPVISIIFIILYVKTKKKLKEYKEFFGSIEQGKMALRQHYMQNSSYQPMQNNGGYYTNVPNMNGYNGYQQPVSQPQYQQPPYQTAQPAQNNIPSEMQKFTNNDQNNF